MLPNEKLLHTFYQSFQNKDYKTMQHCYAEQAAFTDEIFTNLNTTQVRAMWEMLIKAGKDLQLEFNNISATDAAGSAEWIATYTFSATKRTVKNHVKSSFIFENGKIIQHTDRFNFYSWAKQALGTSGFLLGWTGFLKKKVQQTAMKNLAEFMRKSKA